MADACERGKTRWYPDGGTVSAAGPSRPYFHKSIQNPKSVQICFFLFFRGGRGGGVLWKPNFEHWAQFAIFEFSGGGGGGGYFATQLQSPHTLEWRVLCRFWTKKWTTKSEPLEKCVGSQIVSWWRLIIQLMEILQIKKWLIRETSVSYLFQFFCSCTILHVVDIWQEVWTPLTPVNNQPSRQLICFTQDISSYQQRK